MSRALGDHPYAKNEDARVTASANVKLQEDTDAMKSEKGTSYKSGKIDSEFLC